MPDSRNISTNNYTDRYTCLSLAHPSKTSMETQNTNKNPHSLNIPIQILATLVHNK
jgi:hypothetical protein